MLEVPFCGHLKTIKDKNWGEAIKLVGAVTAIILIFDAGAWPPLAPLGERCYLGNGFVSLITLARQTGQTSHLFCLDNK